MKNLLTFFSLLLLCFTVNISKAQIDQAPTKQDALDFINKVLKEYPGTELTDGVGGKETIFPDITAKLDGCNLIFTSICNFPDAVYNTGEDYSFTVFRTKITTINLASVYFTNNIELKSNQKGDIFVVIHQETRKPSGKVKVAYDTPVEDRYVPSISVLFPLSRYHMDPPPAFKDNYYDQRFGAAILFLVKACGGGKMKTETNDKF